MFISPETKEFTDTFISDDTTTQANFFDSLFEKTDVKEDKIVKAESVDKKNLQRLQDDLRKAGYKKLR